MKQPVSNCASHTVTRHDDAVFLVCAPVLEDLKAHAGMEHTRSCKTHLWSGLIHVHFFLERLDIFKVEEIAFDEGAFYLLVGPVYKQF